MADDVTLNSGTGGATLAADDIGGIHYQRIKVVHGADGVNDGDASRASPFPVDGYGFVSPKTSHASAASVAAGASSDLDSSQLTASTTGKLISIVATSSVPFKVEIKTVLNAVESAVLLVAIMGAGKTWEWWAPHKGMISQAYSATAGLDGFRATMTNLDTSIAADLYCTFFWDEV